MKLYLLRLPRPGWDCNEGFVIRATMDQHAREIASAAHADEGPDAWLDPAQTSCDRIMGSGGEGIILNAFNAG